MMDLDRLVSQVCDVAVEVGEFLREQRAAFDRSAVQEKGPHDYVSYVDKASEEQLVTALSALLPEAGFVTEEKTTGQYAGEEYCWVIDPLDGTTNFIHDMAPYCVSIALHSQTELLLGVVYEVCRIEGLLGPWDVAAGCLILTEAGGRVTDFSGGDTYLTGRDARCWHRTDSSTNNY